VISDSRKSGTRLQQTETKTTEATAVMKPITKSRKEDKEKDNKKEKKRFIVRKPVFTTVKQMSRYITVDGIVAEISRRRLEWSQVILEELLTNSWDFLQIYYPPESFTKEDRVISAKVRVDDILSDVEHIKLLRITVRNSNVNRNEVFQNLELIFDYDNWQSTKRNQYLGTGGALGDFLKRSLGMGYASWTLLQAANNQWNEPLVLRFNGQEYRVYLEVDNGINARVRIEGPFSCPASKDKDYTEACVTLPFEKSEANLQRYKLNQFFREFRLGKRASTTMDFVVEDNNKGDSN
jgi:hypothetical protein